MRRKMAPRSARGGLDVEAPPLQRSTSIDSHVAPLSSLKPPLPSSRARSRSLHHPLSGLHHGFQMDLKQAVALEKQELSKLGLPPPVAVADPLPKAVAPDEDDQDADTPPYWLYRQRYVRKAASFTSGQRNTLPPLPCSPPVPIPRRRYSAAAGLGEHATHDVDAKQLQHVSQWQCEARLWDEFWNFKLSLEARESFEAAVTSRGGGKDAGGDGERPRALSSMASTTDTFNEDEEDEEESGRRAEGPEEDEHVRHYGDVFEMDDLH
ncbi:hypothetical protein BBJ28_00010172 [Nothophytophthora sp. Chile5]|nr:hypothetical protein BBJ28_00010172 [Nothophytophthora sp. Chile5]